MTSKSFEKIWKEYTEYCKEECERGGIDCADMMEELDRSKEDYMHFYDYLRYTEEINNGGQY